MSCGGGYGGMSCGGGYGGMSCGGGYGGMSCGGGYGGWSDGGSMPPMGGMATGAPEGYSGAIAPLAPATIVVRVPADATLSFDNTPVASSSSVRVFRSPPLQAGKTYEYTLKAEVTREGQSMTASRQVTVRSGETTEVAIDVPAPGVARK